MGASFTGSGDHTARGLMAANGGQLGRERALWRTRQGVIKLDRKKTSRR
jgi:hypothetical protein